MAKIVKTNTYPRCGKRETQFKNVAMLTIRGAAKMTEHQIDQIVEWLALQARDVKFQGSKYSHRVTARFHLPQRLGKKP